MSSTVLLLLYLNTLYLTCCDASDAATSKLSATDANLTIDGSITETQHATCKVATEELVASARATVTRVLTGACSEKMIDEKLHTLEKNLTRELEEIKTLLYTILENRQNSSKLVKMYDDYHEDRNDVLSPRQPEIDNFNNTIQRTSLLNGSGKEISISRINRRPGQPQQFKDEELQSLLDEFIEIKQPSFFESGSSSFFFYYWQIKRFDEKLASWKTARSERSSTFYIGQDGYAMYIKVTPRYFPDGTVFISVGLTRGRHDSVLEWPFPHKIRLEILDHSPEQPRQDRRSRIWDPSTLCSEYFWGRPKLTGEPDNPECVGLSVSRQVFFSKLPFSTNQPSKTTRYLWGGSITIKLTVYL